MSFPLSEIPSRPLRVGIIGCGWFGRVHLERLSQIPDIHIVSLSDPDEAAMQKLAAQVPDHLKDPQNPNVALYSDWQTLLESDALDFVSINSPNKWHVPQLLAALDAGLHVLCEKPLTMELSEVPQVAAARDKANRLVAIAYQSRYRRDGRALRAALHSGKYGKIRLVSIYSNEDWVTPNIGTWRHDPARCPGGFFGDANGHQLDFMFWATGLQAEWVRATTETRGTPVPMTTWGEARLKGELATGENDSLPFTFTFVGDAHHWREEIGIVTEKADFVMRSGQLLWATDNKGLSPFPETERDPEIATLPDIPDNAFVAALRGGPPVVSLPETVLPVLRFTLGTLESAAKGGIVRLEGA